MKPFESLSSVYKSFLISGGKIHISGVILATLNSLFIMGLISASLVFGQLVPVPDIDMFDLVIESSSVAFVFLMSSFIIFIPIKRSIKYWLFTGLVALEIGVLLDSIDEVVIITSNYWHRIGDIFFLLGVMTTAMSSACWIVFAYRTSTLDKLTQTHNRNFFESAITQYLTRRELRNEGKVSGSLINLDLDNFKHINDAYGHSAGDQVLRIVGNVLQASARKGDIVCRSGGEEFEILLTETSLKQATEVAKRILDNLKASTPDGLPELTASIGITDIRPCDSNDSLRQRADEAMYQAKREGKARINCTLPARPASAIGNA